MSAIDSINWPAADGKVASMDDLLPALKTAATSAYKLERTDSDVQWDGPDVNPNPACSPGAVEVLSPESLEYHGERDRDAMDMILQVAVWIGIEQGQRMLKQENWVPCDTVEEIARELVDEAVTGCADIADDAKKEFRLLPRDLYHRLRQLNPGR